jgi:hypothetical protein
MTFPVVKLCAGRIPIRATKPFELFVALERTGKAHGLGYPPPDLEERLPSEEKAKLPPRGPNSSAIQAMYDLNGNILRLDAL